MSGEKTVSNPTNLRNPASSWNDILHYWRNLCSPQRGQQWCDVWNCKFVKSHVNQQNCKWIERITGPCKKVKPYSFEKASLGAHCSSEINLAKLCSKEHFTKFSIRNNAFNNWVSTSSLVSLVTQREGVWDSSVLWMKPLCPAPTTVGRSHFTHQQK